MKWGEQDRLDSKCSAYDTSAFPFGVSIRRIGRVEFGPILRRHLKAAPLSVAAFARLVGVRPPYIFQVIKGVCPLAARQIDRWADALALTGEDREAFIISAWLLRTPPMVRTYVGRLKDAARKQPARRRPS